MCEKEEEKLDYTIEGAENKHFFVEKADALQSAIRMGCLFPNRTHPDFYGLNILITLLGGFFMLTEL